MAHQAVEPNAQQAIQYDVAILGAGFAGLMAAKRLTEAGYNVVVLDKGRGVGGRLASRRGTQPGERWDHGAQYITATHTDFVAEVARAVEEKTLETWFRQLSTLSGEALGQEKPRYYSPLGMTQWPKALAKGLTVHTSHLVKRLDLTCDGWQLWSEAIASPGSGFSEWHAKAVILTAPIPQTLALLDASQLPFDKIQRNRLEQIIYNPCITFMLQVEAPNGKPFALPTPGGFKLSKQEEPLSWVADNAVKGISSQPGLLTLHCGADFSKEHLDKPFEALLPVVLKALQAQTGSLVVKHWQAHQWRYAFPANPILKQCVALKGLPHCFLAGEAFGGPGKVETAALSGLAAATQVAESLQKAAVEHSALLKSALLPSSSSLKA